MGGVWDDVGRLNLFAGLPPAIQALFFVALALTLVQLAVVLLLALLSVREGRIRHEDADEGDFLWVFFVPALNEEVTIADTVDRLRQVTVTNRAFVVIDDGSDDRTGAILDERRTDDLHVLTRVPPAARVGKAAALNNAWRDVSGTVPASLLSTFGEDRTLVVVVDADGRLDPSFAHGAAGWFADPRVGGLQLAVRIYNRGGLLTFMQDLEFRIFGSTLQLGRAFWGTAGMGGNGQVNRLSALTQVAEANIASGEADGPWRHRLTEDQDLGLSLFAAGWLCRQEMSHAVDQQGLPSFRRLFRQRVRWCQGNMQAMSRMGVFRTARVPWPAKADGVYWLLQPVVQSIIGISTVTAMLLAVFRTHVVIPDLNAWVFILLGFLAFGGTAVGVVRAGTMRGARGLAASVLLVIPYAVYCWSLLPIYAVAAFRQATRRDAWAKTDREAIE